MSARVTIEKGVDLHFRSFVIITREEEEKYYRGIFVPDFRRRQPGLLLPSLEEIRAQIRSILIEQKAESEIERFLAQARQRVKIEILSEELK